MTDTEHLQIQILVADNNLKNAECFLFQARTVIKKALRNYIETYKVVHDLQQKRADNIAIDDCLKNIQKFYETSK